MSPRRLPADYELRTLVLVAEGRFRHHTSESVALSRVPGLVRWSAPLRRYVLTGRGHERLVRAAEARHRARVPAAALEEARSPA